jgi:hypothetical protein
MQTVSLGAHTVWQLPATHAAPALHGLPQPPQLAGSTRGSTHFDPHCTVPPPQLVAQAPLEQTCPAAHAAPHVPQLALSFWRLVQEPAQSVLPVPQPETQAPALHTFVVPQTLPQ